MRQQTQHVLDGGAVQRQFTERQAAQRQQFLRMSMRVNREWPGWGLARVFKWWPLRAVLSRRPPDVHCSTSLGHACTTP